MSTSTPELNCVICTSIPSTSTSNESESIDENLVIFFLQNFLKYPLLPFSVPAEEENSSGGFLEDFVKQYGKPKEYIWFCPSCLPTIQEARDLQKKLKTIETKLLVLRQKVEEKVVESFGTDGEKQTECKTGNAVFRTVRQKVFERRPKKSAQSKRNAEMETDIKVKEEYSSGMEEDTEEVAAPYFVNLDAMSPGYPVIYPNVKLEVEEGPGNFEASTVIDPSKVEETTEVELRETIYERRSRRQVTYKEIDEKSDSEDEEDSRSMSDNSYGTKEGDEASGSESEALSDSMDMSDLNDPDTDDEFILKPKRTRKVKKAVKIKRIKQQKKIRLTKPGKGDGRGGHRIKSSVECRTCPVCKQVFGCHSKMSVHLNVKHLRNVLFNCDVCKKGFMRKDYLRTHMEIHLPEEDRLLKQALRELKGSEKAIVSEKEKGESTLESRTCTVCGKSFDKLSVLKIHVECVHNNVMAYECKVCNKKFKWKDLLKKHMILHKDGETRTKSVLPGSVAPAPLSRSFQCTFEGCPAAFRRKRDLEVHCRIHSGAKDFLCALCGISFRHEWSFRRHNILRHQAPEAKKYQCESCGKTFKIKWLLDQHLMSKSHGGAGLPKRTRRKAKDKETANSEKDLKASSERIQMATNVINANVPTSSNTNQSVRSVDNSVTTVMDNDNYSGESQSPVDQHHDRRDEAFHMQQYYQQQNFRPDLLNLLPHRDILNYSNFGVPPNSFGGFGYNVPSNDSQSQ